MESRGLQGTAPSHCLPRFVLVEEESSEFPESFLQLVMKEKLSGGRDGNPVSLIKALQ